MNSAIDNIKKLICGISEVSSTTIKSKCLCEISRSENPLNPDLLSYCFDEILGFEVDYKIFEKIDYIIEFDYKGTYGRAMHSKLSYTIDVNRNYKNEIIKLFSRIKPLLSEAFLEYGKSALDSNNFTMENETIYYSTKFHFYQDKVENLQRRKMIITDKCKGKFITYSLKKGVMCSEPMCQGYLAELNREIIYSIEIYIDVYFSYIEHVLTLLYPFLSTFDRTKSYMKKIYNPKWNWYKKIMEVLGIDYVKYADEFRLIKEVYRNRNTHGMFTREMKAYIRIPNFGRYPMYIGKNYLKGFMEDNECELTYEKYLGIKAQFNEFLHQIEKKNTIPMMFVESGLPIPVITEQYTNKITTKEEADRKINYLYYVIDRNNNMDW